MSYEEIHYFEDLPIGFEINHIGFEPWHRHQNVTEIIFVLSGALDVTMSCCHFQLKKHDIAVMNQGTFHNVRGVGEENVAISLYLDLNYYEQYIKYIKYIVFIMEPENRKDQYQEIFKGLRSLIAGILIEAEANREGFKERILNHSMKLVKILENNFSEVAYYNPSIEFNSIKIERYYLMKKYMDENYREKTLLEDISSKEFFCKSYLSHLFRDVSTFSLKDIICFNRNWKSEELLITSKKSVNEISEECGYSDPKYYYKHFKKWYECTPYAYRRKYRKEIIEKAESVCVPTSAVVDELNKFVDPFNRIEYPKNQFAACFLLEENILRSVDKEKAVYDWARVRETVDSFREIQMNPFVAIQYKSRTRQEWRTILKQYAEIFEKEQMPVWEHCLIYSEPELTAEINGFIGELQGQMPGINIKSMLTNHSFLNG